MIDIKLFVVEWNNLVKSFNEDFFTLKLFESSRKFETSVEQLISQTNISDFPIGSLNFLPQFVPYDTNMVQFGFYDENEPLLLHLTTHEILAKNPYKEDPTSYSFVSVNEDNFIRTLPLYLSIYLRGLEKRAPSHEEIDQIIQLVGGGKYAELYSYLFKQIYGYTT